MDVYCFFYMYCFMLGWRILFILFFFKISNVIICNSMENYVFCLLVVDVIIIKIVMVWILVCDFIKLFWWDLLFWLELFNDWCCLDKSCINFSILFVFFFLYFVIGLYIGIIEVKCKLVIKIIKYMFVMLFIYGFFLMFKNIFLFLLVLLKCLYIFIWLYRFWKFIECLSIL